MFTFGQIGGHQLTYLTRGPPQDDYFSHLESGGTGDCGENSEPRLHYSVQKLLADNVFNMGRVIVYNLGPNTRKFGFVLA